LEKRNVIPSDEPLMIGRKKPVHYTSIYGYPKDRIPVFKQSDAKQASPIGFIKEEIVRDGDGGEVSRTYYERNGWREHGQPRFFASPEALVLRFGGKLARKTGLKKPRATAAPKAARGGKKAGPAKPARAKKIA
jgi:hypothetical protein